MTSRYGKYLNSNLPSSKWSNNHVHSMSYWMKIPNAHLSTFLEVCDMLKLNGVSNDAISLRVFLFSLKSRAKKWLQTLPRALVTTWDQLAKLFLTRYFPSGRTTKFWHDIASVFQQEGETLYEAWERYNYVLRCCTQHGLPCLMEVQTFSQGLTPSLYQTIDFVAGGIIGNKTPEEAR